MSIHAALQLRAHKVQFVHFETLMTGFKKAIVPYANKIDDKRIEIVPVKRLIDAITACVSAQ